MWLDDFNGHVGRHIDGVYGGCCESLKRLEGEMLLVFWLKKYVCQVHGLRERGKDGNGIQNWKRCARY